MAEGETENPLQLLRDGVDANFTVICQGREWKVNRAILFRNTKYFEALCIGGFKENEDATVDFKEDNADVIDQILVWLYTDVYDDFAVVEKKNKARELASSESSAPASLIDNDSQPTFLAQETASGTKGWKVGVGGGLRQLPLSYSRDEISEILTTAILLCQSAQEKLLSKLADQAIEQLFQRQFDFVRSDFANVLEVMFLHTDNDSEVRGRMIKLCLDNYKLLKKDAAVSSVLEEHEPVLWQMLVAERRQGELYTEYSFNNYVGKTRATKALATAEEAKASEEEAHNTTRLELAEITRRLASTQMSLKDTKANDAGLKSKVHNLNRAKKEQNQTIADYQAKNDEYRTENDNYRVENETLKSRLDELLADNRVWRSQAERLNFSCQPCSRSTYLSNLNVQKRDGKLYAYCVCGRSWLLSPR